MKTPRLTALIMVAVIMLSLTVIPAGAQYFTDVSIGHWARESINYAADNGYIDHKDKFAFDPTGVLTRADVAEIIYRFEGSPDVEAATHFADVAVSSGITNPVSWVYKNGIMIGTSKNTFEPSRGITRQDLAVVFFRYGSFTKSKKQNVMSKRADISDFPDASSVKDYAVEAVSWAVAVKLITGEVGGIIAPSKSVVRQTGAEMLKRFGIYVEGINFNRDIYGFTADKIKNDTYHITTNHLSALYAHLKLTGELNDVYEDDGLSVKERIEADISGKRADSSFGMALSVILNKVGKLDLTRHFGDGADNIRDINTFTRGSELESAISFYDLSRHATSVRDLRLTTKCLSADSEWTAMIDSLPVIIDENGLILFTYGYMSEGKLKYHTVVMYDYEAVATSSYTFYVYDPDSLTVSTLTAELKTDGGKAAYDLRHGDRLIVEADRLCDFANIYNKYCIYDLDSYYNDFDAGTSEAN